MLGLESFEAAQRTFARIELLHMIKKDQIEAGGQPGRTPAEQFYSLAAEPPDRQPSPRHR